MFLHVKRLQRYNKCIAEVYKNLRPNFLTSTWGYVVFYQGGCSQIINQSVGEGFDNYGQYVGGVSGFVDQVHLHLAMRAALIGDCLHIPVVYG